MTGLLQRLAARGSGRAGAEGTQRLSAPVQPRFAVPEAGQEIEDDTGGSGIDTPDGRPEMRLTEDNPATQELPAVGDPKPAMRSGKDTPPETPAEGADVPTPGLAAPETPTLPAESLSAVVPNADVNATDETAPAEPTERPRRKSILPDNPEQQYEDLKAPVEVFARAVEDQPPEQVASFSDAAADPGKPDLTDLSRTGPPVFTEDREATEIIQRDVPVPEPRREPEPAAPGLSIGRIDVIFERPTAPPAPRRRTGPTRTRGFDGYETARLGRRR